MQQGGRVRPAGYTQQNAVNPVDHIVLKQGLFYSTQQFRGLLICPALGIQSIHKGYSGYFEMPASRFNFPTWRSREKISFGDAKNKGIKTLKSTKIKIADLAQYPIFHLKIWKNRLK